MTRTTDDKPLADILAEFVEKAAAIEAREPAPPVDYDAEMRARRLKALGGKGWPARALRIAGGPAYDDARGGAYLDALRDRDGSGEARIVILAGQPGSGKTAACARWALTRPGPGASARFATPRFLTAAAFFRSSRYRREGDDTTVTRDDLLREQTLVLDDLGVEYADANGSYRVDIDELANEFYSDDRTLVISTNIAYASPKARAAIAARGVAVDSSAPTFLDRYGERILDRVRECGAWVDSSSPSMRRRAA